MDQTLKNKKADKSLQGTGLHRVEDYISSTQKVKLKCDKGHVVSMLLKTALIGGCNICRHNDKIDTALKGKPVNRVSDYIDSKSKIKFKGDCGHYFESIPRSVAKSGSCSACGKKKRGINKYTNEVIDGLLSSRGISRLDNYNANPNESLRWKCDCGYEFKMSWAGVNRGRGCRKCSLEKKRYSQSEAQEKLDKDGKGLRIISGFRSMKEECLIGCSNGHEWTAKPQSVHSCAYCSGLAKLRNEDIDKRLEGREILRIDDYINANSKIQWGCLNDDCGHKWHSTPHNVVDNYSGCPKCSGYMSDSLYIGRIETEGGFYIKTGKTCKETMKQRYSGGETPTGRVKSVEEFQIVKVGYEVCNDAESKVLAKMSDILGKPLAGREWFKDVPKHYESKIIEAFEEIVLEYR